MLDSLVVVALPVREGQNLVVASREEAEALGYSIHLLGNLGGSKEEGEAAMGGGVRAKREMRWLLVHYEKAECYLFVASIQPAYLLLMPLLLLSHQSWSLSSTICRFLALSR